ncbi:MAG: dihydroxyacetone kinase subunit L [Chloroflexaceae bacterium]|nr:dihydroxyacetone kinase subunit L [Chloroflexaceae bacterium]NJL35211.1 dihydroxyacetone kinase subunit L [Chloroflexaceae bacterium]NJO05537.1 dihydroxyacetone kinase subunit L [Chloroflexaceae bacterium]
MHVTAQHVIRFLERVAAVIKEHRDELTQLDANIGDADHGANMDRGFSAVLAKLPTLADKDIGTILKTTGMTLISTVGGASGPLYGTAFMRAASVLTDKTELTPHDVTQAFEAALEGLKVRGKAQRGEKTMIDAIEPGVAVLRTANGTDEPFLAVLQRAVAAVEAGMQATIPMQATKGRASYLGERSIGHQDPGATSSYYIARALLDTLQEPD